jgi:hypothetical protein
MRGRRSLDKFMGSLDKSERLIGRGLEAMLLEVVYSVMYTIQNIVHMDDSFGQEPGTWGSVSCHSSFYSIH